MKQSNIEKAIKTTKEKRDKMGLERQDLALKIQEETKACLLPAIKERMEEVSNFIVEKVKNKGEDLNSAQIMSLIAKRSVSDIATIRTKTYTAYELGEAFNVYIDMLDRINQYKQFPPTKGSFCALLGISTMTYNSYKEDPEKYEIMGIIDNYISSSLNTSALVGETREISSIFTLKASHGMVEQQAPQTVKVEHKLDIDTIQEQLKAVKQRREVLEAEWEEVELDE